VVTYPCRQRSIDSVPEDDWGVMPWNIIIILGMDQSQAVLLPVGLIDSYILCDVVPAQPFISYKSCEVVEQQ
jgi:hypothetical protein